MCRRILSETYSKKDILYQVTKDVLAAKLRLQWSRTNTYIYYVLVHNIHYNTLYIIIVHIHYIQAVS